MATICFECEYLKHNAFGDCNNPDLRITDFVDGTKSCADLNTKGDCEGFKAKPKRESIYELKADEDLAKTEPVQLFVDFEYGSDANAGTRDSPFCTREHAEAIAGPKTLITLTRHEDQPNPARPDATT